MRRKLNESSPVKTAPAETASEGGSMLPDVLAARGEFVRHEQIDRASGAVLPYVGFYSSKAVNALDVRAALGSPAEGTPYLSVTGEDGETRIYSASTFGYVIVDEFPFWVTLDEEFRPSAAWLTKQPFGASYNGEPIKGNMLAVMLVLPGQAGGLPPELRPAVAALTTFRNTKLDFVKQHLDAVERTTKPAWAASPANAQVAANMPPRYRVVSEIVVERRTSRSTGRPYTVAEARTNTIGLAQIEAFAQFSRDARCQQQLSQVIEAFERRKADIRALAAETAKRGG